MKSKKIVQTFWCKVVDLNGKMVDYVELTSSDIAFVIRTYRICSDDKNHRSWIPKTDFDRSFAYCPFRFIITGCSRCRTDVHKVSLDILCDNLSSYMSNLIYNYYV